MAPASLTTFPAELLIQVYKSLNNVKDVTALNLASPRFHGVWRENIVSISDAVFSRTIKNYVVARELVKVQQKSVERNPCEDNGHQDPYRQALERNKLMVSNAHDSLKFYQEERRWLKRDETFMSKIYYRICMLVLAKEDTFAQSSCLASFDLETLKLMLKVFHEHVRTLTLQPNGKFSAQFTSSKVGGISPEDIPVNVVSILYKHISALHRRS